MCAHYWEPWECEACQKAILSEQIHLNVYIDTCGISSRERHMATLILIYCKNTFIIALLRSFTHRERTYT
jgi:predicted TIM-barrel fold metal-dependent hydrolase